MCCSTKGKGCGNGGAVTPSRLVVRLREMNGGFNKMMCFMLTLVFFVGIAGAICRECCDKVRNCQQGGSPRFANHARCKGMRKS